ncbi:hypothetical protein OHA72_31630 [Dactylosporangium sp. NBC_01737]|uniref:hypothetical protein n=1 Tax=Dactylosporangium sp. NBC_01737 TaxID=2975959 RepID=UPI002E105F60|nr:hypothetical protein OHA72_31630 [Dactylosporangium sp. NBC_01737]
MPSPDRAPAGRFVAVAEGPGGCYATVDDAGSVSVWAGPGELRSRFDAIPGDGAETRSSDSVAVTTGPAGIEIVVGSWHRGVAGFDPEGGVRWRRRDIRHVHDVRALPDAGGARRVAGVVTERQGGLVLGQTGGTRLTVRGGRFLAGWADGSLLAADRKGSARRLARDGTVLWRLPLTTFAVLDAAVDDGALISVAARRLTYVGPDGTVAWRVPTPHGEAVPIVRADPDGDGWICLSTASARHTVPTVWRVARDGGLSPVAEVPAPPDLWLGFAGGGTHLLGSDGRLVELGLGPAPWR